MHEINTLFPNRIDNLSFFNDMRLDDVETYEQYQTLMAQKKYDQASESLQNSESEYYGAYLYNRLNRRLIAIGEYLREKEKPEQVFYVSETPTTANTGSTWIG